MIALGKRWRQLVLKNPKYTFWTLFSLTILTTTLSGSEWTANVSVLSVERPLTVDKFLEGLRFSLPFLFMLSCHEFGHYLAARWHKVTTTLPFYIPLWLGFLGTPSLGTLGAFIKMKSAIRSTKQYFDIGIAGPIAGFLVALGVLYYGFTHLPSVDYIFKIHPEYASYGTDYPQYVYLKGVDIALGNNLLFLAFQHYVAPADAYIPPPQEWVHYPYIFAGFLMLLLTALNLFPIGQLDGGHILYGLLGSLWHKRIAYVVTLLFIFYAGLGFVGEQPSFYATLLLTAVYVVLLYFSLHFVRDSKQRWRLLLLIFVLQRGVVYVFPEASGFHGWLLFSLLVGRFLGVEHPPAQQENPLSVPRKMLGWFALLVFVLCFSPRPFTTT